MQKQLTLISILWIPIFGSKYFEARYVKLASQQTSQFAVTLLILPIIALPINNQKNSQKEPTCYYGLGK